MTVKFEEHSFKTVRGVNYTYLIPYRAEKAAKMIRFKMPKLVKIHSSSIQNPHAHFQYAYNMFAKFDRHPLKTVGEVSYTRSIPNNAKYCLK